MEAIAFVNNYLNYIDEISKVVKPELQPIMDELKEIDPHDLVRPDSYFIQKIQSVGSYGVCS